MRAGDGASLAVDFYQVGFALIVAIITSVHWQEHERPVEPVEASFPAELADVSGGAGLLAVFRGGFLEGRGCLSTVDAAGKLVSAQTAVAADHRAQLAERADHDRHPFGYLDRSATARTGQAGSEVISHQ